MCNVYQSRCDGALSASPVCVCVCVMYPDLNMSKKTHAHTNTHGTSTHIKNDKFVLLPNAQPINKFKQQKNKHTTRRRDMDQHIFGIFLGFVGIE